VKKASQVTRFYFPSSKSLPQFPLPPKFLNLFFLLNSMKTHEIINLLLRYTILLILGLGNLYFIYLIFTPLTIYPIFAFLKIFYQTTLIETTILIENKIIELIPACIAGAAFYFLIILNLTTKMPIKKRIYSLTYSLAFLLLLNISRIILLTLFFINSLSFFDITHKIFWYGLSTVFVVCIWFSEVKIFKIKDIPIYSDILRIKSLVKL